MNYFLDNIWNYIESFLNYSILLLDKIISPLEVLGAWFVIFILAFLVVIITRTIAKFYVTKRYTELEKEYKYWQGIREEAMKHPDKTKGKRLARNIDKAELNKAYYDYFFEGLLKHFIVNVLPILLMVVYITKVYTPENLFKRFGEKSVFSISFGSSTQTDVSSLLWFIICLIFSFILYAILKRVIKKRYAKKEPA